MDISDWLKDVPRTKILLKNGKFDNLITESLRESTKNSGFHGYGLEMFLDNAPRAKKIFLGLLCSGELDTDVIRCLDYLLQSLYSHVGEMLLSTLLEVKKDPLVHEWLEKLTRKQRPYALRMLLKAAPETKDLLKELLGDERWMKIAMKYREWLAESDLPDESCVLLDMLLESPELPEGHSLPTAQ